MRLIERLRALIAAEAAPRPASISPRRPSGTIASGFVDPRQRDNTRRIAITLDQSTFDRVRDHAAQRNISFAAAARELIERATSKEPRR